MENLKETILWMNFFDMIRKKVSQSAISASSFDTLLTFEINNIRMKCESILNPPPPKVYNTRKPTKKKVKL